MLTQFTDAKGFTTVMLYDDSHLYTDIINIFNWFEENTSFDFKNMEPLEIKESF